MVREGMEAEEGIRLLAVQQDDAPLIENFLESALPALQVLPMRCSTNLFKWLSAGIGLCWGVPWIQASETSADFFFPSVEASILSPIFAVGIVVTLGISGLWVMLEMAKLCSRRSEEEKALLKSVSRRVATTGIILALAPFACIAPIYAIWKYSNGAQKYLVIIDCPVYFAYSFLGYSKFKDKLAMMRYEKSVSPEIKAIKHRVIKGCNRLAQSEEVIAVDVTPQQLLKRMLALSEQQGPPQIAAERCPTVKKGIQGFFTLLIPVCSSIVSILLSREFLEKNIWDDEGFSITVALLAEIPIFFVNMIATYDTFGKLLATISCRSEPSLLGQCGSCVKTVVPILSVLTACTAPAAAAYIAYNTFDEWDISEVLAWFAVFFISSARLIFSFFTLNTSFHRLAGWKYAGPASGQLPPAADAKRKWVNKYLFLQNFTQVMSTVHPKHFKSLQGLVAEVAADRGVPAAQSFRLIPAPSRQHLQIAEEREVNEEQRDENRDGEARNGEPAIHVVYQ